MASPVGVGDLPSAQLVQPSGHDLRGTKEDALGKSKDPFQNTSGSWNESFGKLKASERTAIAVEAARRRADEGRLKLPEFDWYLGPMYKKYADILAERARLENAEVVKKKVAYSVPPEPPWVKHTKPRPVWHTVPKSQQDRPLDKMGRHHLSVPTTPRSARKDGSQTARSAHTPRSLKDSGAAQISSRR